MLRELIEKIEGRVPVGAKRSSKWAKLRDKYIEENPTCAICGGKESLAVHHILPFWAFPEKELDLDNLIVLCGSKKRGVNCHLFFGHMGNYKSFNPFVKNDAAEWRFRLRRARDLRG